MSKNNNLNITPIAGVISIILAGILGLSGAGVLSLICLVIAGVLFWIASA